MSVLFVYYPRCSTCLKAKRFLDELGVDYTVRDIKEERPTAEELKQWCRASGLPLKKFINTSGQIYRAMGLKNRIPTMQAEELYTLLATDGMLVKRPLLIGEAFALAGFREAEWREKLKEAKQG